MYAVAIGHAPIFNGNVTRSDILNLHATPASIRVAMEAGRAEMSLHIHILHKSIQDRFLVDQRVVGSGPVKGDASNGGASTVVHGDFPSPMSDEWERKYPTVGLAAFPAIWRKAMLSASLSTRGRCNDPTVLLFGTCVPMPSRSDLARPHSSYAAGSHGHSDAPQSRCGMPLPDFGFGTDGLAFS